MAETYNSAHWSMKISEDPVDVARVLYLNTRQNKGTEIGSAVAEVSVVMPISSTAVGGHLGQDKESMDESDLVDVRNGQVSKQ